MSWIPWIINNNNRTSFNKIKFTNNREMNTNLIERNKENLSNNHNKTNNSFYRETSKKMNLTLFKINNQN